MSRHLTKNGQTLKPLLAPIVFVAGTFLLQSVVTFTALIANTDFAQQLSHVITTLLYLSYAFLLIRLIDVMIWGKLMRARGYDTPYLLRDIVAILIWYGAACAIASIVFNQPMVSILAGSTVTLGLFGFSLQKPILDAFSGIVLALQQPLKVGDWLQVGDENEIGQITEMNWRAVHLVTADEIGFIVPNGQLLGQHIKVYSDPEQFFRDEIQVTLPYSVTTHQGERILLGAANQVEEIAAIPRKSIVSIADYTDRGVLWRLLYWCPDAGRIPVFRFKVHQNILRNLHYVGIDVPVPILDLRRVPSNADEAEEMRGIDPLVQHVSIFAAMTAEELRQLSTLTKNRLIIAGTPLLRQGDPGDSLFILRDGLLEVCIATDDLPETTVARIHPGDFFGERSLLLGEPRSASIVPVVDSMVSEIPREAMVQLMRSRPELATYLGEVLTERQAKSAAKLASNHHVVEQPQSMFDQMVNRIRAFLDE
jgi:small-conductance mechanosensitive channel